MTAPDFSFTHPDTLTDEDFAALAYILGAYVGAVMKRKEAGEATFEEVNNAIAKTQSLMSKLNALQSTM